MFRLLWRLTVISLLLVSTSAASDRRMTGSELRAVLSVVRIFKLGGPSGDHVGMLFLKANGTGRGAVFYDNGDATNFSGTWRVNRNFFCRDWNNFDGGQEVCEAWIYITDTSARVTVQGQEIGVISW